MLPDLKTAKSNAAAAGPEPTRLPNLLYSRLRTLKAQPHHSHPHPRNTNMTSLGTVDKPPSSRPGTSQHPSHYPPTALYALHQAGLSASPVASPSISLKGEPFPSKLASTSSSSGLTSRPRSFQESGTAIDPRPAFDSRGAGTSTPTTSERRTSDCSATSSEFSLTSAFPPSSIREGILEQPVQSLTTHKPTNGIGNDSVGVFLHQEVDRSEADSRKQSKGKGPKGKTLGKKEEWDSPTLSTKRSQMKLSRRPKGVEAESVKKNRPFQDSNRSNVISPPFNHIDSVKPRPRLRTITLASHKSTQKSPPPLFNSRSTRTDIPPSPMTPRPVPRVIEQEMRDSSLEDSSIVTLQVARPPRSMKRSPSPMRSVKQPTDLISSLPSQEQQQEGKRSFDYDGIEWEMLNNGRLQQDVNTLPLARNIDERDSSADKRNSIERWREYAKATFDDAFEGSSEVTSETGHRDKTAAPLPTAQSSGSPVAAESFQSMSSMAPSLFFAAMSEAPTTPTTRRMQRPSTSPHSPTTSSFANLPTTSQQPSPDLHTRQFHRPSTAVKHEQSTASGSFAGVGTHLTRSRYHVTPRMFSPHAISEKRHLSPGQKSVVSDASEVFQSADEGESSLSPPFSQHKSPREHLYRQYHNAQKRASRLFGRSDALEKVDSMEDGASRRQSVLHLTTSQLMALSEEAESGLLDTAQWQRRHAQLLTTDEEASPGDDPTSDSVPTPELSRLSATSREEDSPNTPQSPLWQSASAVNEQQSQEDKGYFENSLFASQQQRLPLAKASSGNQLASPQPPRLVRRRSKRLSGVKQSMDDTSLKPVMTFIKLESLPIQLVEAPTPSSWRSALTVPEFEGFSKTFGSKEMHRQEVIEELSVTEWNFVISLSSILRVFSLPLRKGDMSFQDNVPLEVARLFNWLDDILAFHVKLLKSLDKVRNRHPSALVVCVAGAICKHIEGLSIHQSYLVNFEKVTTLLEDVRRSNNKGDLSSFDEVVERQSRLPECRGMALSSFLLKPVQRLMKYPLFFKQLAELTPGDHPDYQETQQLYSMTEKVIRDMNCVKAREEDYQELKLLESRVRGLPDGFHLASRQRRLIRQGSLKSVCLSEMDRLMLSSQQTGIDRSFSSAPVTPPLPNIRPLGLQSSTTSSGFSPSPRLGSGAMLLSPDGGTTPPASNQAAPVWSTLPFDASTSSTQSRTTSMHSNSSSPAATPFLLSEAKKSIAPAPPPRPTSRKASMANLFSRAQMQSKVDDETTTLHAFVFDDLLLLTTMHKEEDKDAIKTSNKASKKKSGSQGKVASPMLSLGMEDSVCYTLVARGGLSRILGVTNRVMRNDATGSSTLTLEVEVLPLSMIGESLRSSGSSGSISFVFTFTDDAKSSAQETFSLWEKAFEKSFLSCIQAQRRQMRLPQTDLSSPIFGAISTERQQATPTTAQADWLRRRRHVTQMVNNAAKCGDRTTLTALLQAGLPFPRSPSQQNLSDTANRSVAMVEKGSPLLPSQEIPKESTKETKILKKSTSQSHLSTHKKSPILGVSIFSSINVDDVARVGDLGSASAGIRILDEERREEKTWWSLRLKEIEVEAERNDELDRLLETRRARVAEPASADTPSMMRVRRGVPVLKS